jgi:hypothetical protein
LKGAELPEGSILSGHLMRLELWPVATFLTEAGNEIIIWFEVMKAGLLLNGVTWLIDVHIQVNRNRVAQPSTGESLLNGYSLQAAA